jgi:TatD DNase family protein
MRTAPILVDAHTHFDMYEVDELQAALAQLQAQRVLSWSMSVDPRSYRRGQKIARDSQWVMTSFGIHPWYAPDHAAALPALLPLFEESRHFGEVGLDYRFVEDKSAYPAQHQVFTAFLRSAYDRDQIVNLHTSGAEADVARLVRDYRVRRAVVHWYSGPAEPFQALVRLGCYFSIGVELTSSEKIREIAAAVPAERLLTETDNPGGMKWVTGARGMPEAVGDVVAELARVRGEAVEETRERVAENFRRLLEDDWPPVVALDGKVDLA